MFVVIDLEIRLVFLEMSWDWIGEYVLILEGFGSNGKKVVFYFGSFFINKLYDLI